jgi:hypothetical protein
MLLGGVGLDYSESSVVPHNSCFLENSMKSRLRIANLTKEKEPAPQEPLR